LKSVPLHVALLRAAMP